MQLRGTERYEQEDKSVTLSTKVEDKFALDCNLGHPSSFLSLFVQEKSSR